MHADRDAPKAGARAGRAMRMFIPCLQSKGFKALPSKGAVAGMRS